MRLNIFYDSQCPLCMMEMRQLKAQDHADKISLIDLHAQDFETQYPGIDKADAMRCLYGQLDSGQVLRGLDVTCQAWSLVGKLKWIKVLRWPLIRQIADMSYRLFAPHRYRISYLLTGKSRCQGEACRIDDTR